MVDFNALAITKPVEPIGVLNPAKDVVLSSVGWVSDIATSIFTMLTKELVDFAAKNLGLSPAQVAALSVILVAGFILVKLGVAADWIYEKKELMLVILAGLGILVILGWVV